MVVTKWGLITPSPPYNMREKVMDLSVSSSKFNSYTYSLSSLSILIVYNIYYIIYIILYNIIQYNYNCSLIGGGGIK